MKKILLIIIIGITMLCIAIVVSLSAFTGNNKAEASKNVYVGSYSCTTTAYYMKGEYGFPIDSVNKPAQYLVGVASTMGADSLIIVKRYVYRIKK